MSTARHDSLLAALIARLPPSTRPWNRSDRIAWLRMTALAFDVVYGPCRDIRIATDETDAAADGGRVEGASCASANPAKAESAMTCRFYVDRDGFAMGDGRPIAMDDLPPAVTLWDERTGVECGDPAAILWRDVGTTRRSLPPGVSLKPAVETA